MAGSSVVPWYRTGAISLTNASPTATGTGGPLWTLFVDSGDAILVNGELLEVDEVVSDTEITLAQNWTGSTVVDQPYAAIKTSINWHKVSEVRGRITEMLARVNKASYLHIVSGTPSEDLGAVDHIALDPDTGQYYVKTIDGWEARGSLAGAVDAASGHADRAETAADEAEASAASVAADKIEWKGPYSDVTAYDPRDAVSYDGSSFVARITTTGNEPPDSAAVLTGTVQNTWWDLMAATSPGTPGDTGSQGEKGWSPELAVVEDGARRVLQVVDWHGGAGVEPASGEYIGLTGLTSVIGDAVDIRGSTGLQGIQGIPGDAGDTGWSPEFAVVTDGERRVLQVDDWAGGEGTPPATGDYVGPDGLTAVLAEAVDIRGAVGAAGADGDTGEKGWSPIFELVSDSARRVLRLDSWTGGEGSSPAVGTYVGPSGMVATAAEAVDLRGATGVQGDKGWSPNLALESDGARRVAKVTAWTGGAGSPPASGSYIGPLGLVATAAEATDLRGPAGAGTGDVVSDGTITAGHFAVFVSDDVIEDGGEPAEVATSGDYQDLINTPPDPVAMALVFGS